MNATNSTSSAALIWALASLGNTGGSGGGTGTPGKDGNSWIVVNEPLSDGFSAPLGSQPGDLIVDSTGEIFRVGTSNTITSTGVVLGGDIQAKSLYELYLDLNPTNKLNEATFKDRFLEALEEDSQVNLFEIYKSIGGTNLKTEQEFNDKFIKLMDFDPDSLDIQTDRIVSDNGKNHVISDDSGIDALGEVINLVSNTTFNITGEETFITSSKDTLDGSTHVQNLVDPVSPLDAVNLRTLQSEVDKLVQQIKDLETAVNGRIDDLEAKHDKDIADLNQTITDLETSVNQKITDLEDLHKKDIETLTQTITDLETKHDQDIAGLKNDLNNLAAQVVAGDDNLQKQIDELRNLHNSEYAEILELITELRKENGEIKQSIIDLTEKHNTEVAYLQKQIDELENSVITAINLYLSEKLPEMIEDEVKEQLKDLDLGTCGCKDPDVIMGGDAELKRLELLIFDNGNANASDFEYIMTSNIPDDTLETIYREAWGGDADPKDDPEFLTFLEWLESNPVNQTFWGGDGDMRDDIIKGYRIFFGGTSDATVGGVEVGDNN